MVRLSSSQYPPADALYRDHSAYFPLIAAVLSGEQEGVVHADREEDPAQVYVEHAFGFAQVFGSSLPAFEHALLRYLLIDKAFACAKVRLYTPHSPDLLQSPDCTGLRSWRQHFQFDIARDDFEANEPQVNGLVLAQVNADHVDLIEQAFGVVGRFWRNPVDFVGRSNAVLALMDGQPAAICYAAAVAGGKAEIDVSTLPTYRRLGLARAVVRRFNQRCLAQNVLPLWDCFTNNSASMALCQSNGFVPLGDPYPFFTISR